MPAYLQELTLRLAQGAGDFSPELRQRHARYLRAAQNPDGGFSGREGASDLYYTGFALRGLVLLGHLEGETARRAAGFLQQQLATRTTVLDLVSLVFAGSLLKHGAGLDPFQDARADWRDAVAGALETYRRPDGGFANTPEGQSSSTYNTFLVALCLELLERPLINAEAIVPFVEARRREDGGYVEIGPMRRSGTNPTAAAVALLNMFDALPDDAAQETARFLSEQQTGEGGLRANTHIPVADVLSTFTATLTLTDLNGLHNIDTAAAERYVRQLEQPEGGFHAAAWDTAVDVEYTFYGLGSLALLG